MGKSKFEIKFNPQARKYLPPLFVNSYREYLTGFKKRKDERRKKAQDKIKQEEKDKRKELVAEKRKGQDRGVVLTGQNVEEVGTRGDIREEGTTGLNQQRLSQINQCGGPHFVGQQLAFLSPQEYVPGKLSDQFKQASSATTTKGANSGAGSLSGTGAPFQITGTQSQVHANNIGSNALSANNNSLNIAQYQMSQQPPPRAGGGGNSKKFPYPNQSIQNANAASEQRQLNLAEMVRSSNIIKQSSFQKRTSDQANLQQPPSQTDYIKGTQVSKDFQLVAEPLIPKGSNNQSQQQTQQLQHNNSQNQNLKAQQSTSSSQITYSNTAISTIQQQDKSSDGSGLGTGNHYSQNSSRKNLESYYSTANGNKQGGNFSEVQQTTVQNNNNQAISNIIMQQNQQIYSTNRSVAAKAGQMQIFSNDKYNHLQNNHSTQNTKFQSPGKQLNNAKMANHHQSASQQIENMMDLQQMRIRTNSGQNTQNQKYAEYLNRFSTSQSIDQTQNIQLKYRDLRNQMLDQQDDNSSKYNYQETSSIPDQTPLEGLLNTALSGAQIHQQHSVGSNVSNSNHIYTNQNHNKRSPILQKENRLETIGQNNQNNINNGAMAFGLGISGEQMHLEEKTFLKKMGGMIQNTIETTAPTTQRHAGSSRKRQEFSVNAKSIQRGFRPGIDSQHLAIQPRTRYDYVFIRITEDTYEKEFMDKIAFTRDPNDQSPSTLSIKNKRISSLATNSAKKEDSSQQQTQQLLMMRHQKSLRGSQEYLKEQPIMFSPNNKQNSGQWNPQGMEDLISIQNLQPDGKQMGFSNQQAPTTPKISVNTCSIISTNHTHIKVITHQGLIGSFNDLTLEQATQQQIALNECVHDVMTKVQEKGRVVKTTQKKKYILNSLNAPHMRVASIYVIVLDNNVNFFNDNPDLRATLMSESSNTSSNNFNSTLTKLQNSKAIQKAVLKKDQQIIMKNQDPNKNIRARNNSTINSKGYESESEVKSTNSTTTSSTLQHFIPTRNFDQNGGSNTTKNSSRSLSQKGTQPRKNFQKAQQPAPVQSEEQTFSQFVVQRDGNIKKYPPTKIKILSPYDLTQHETHRINISLNNYNNFITLCFKNKGKVNIPAVVKLGKQLGLPITSSMFTDGAIKSREQANMLKEKLIAYLCKVINEENIPENMPENPLVQEAIAPLNQPVHQYKCFVGKGNNSILIRTLFKTRFWWLLHDKEEIEKVNFMWTQLRKNPIMDTFPCKYEDKKSGLRIGGSSNNTVMQTPGKLKGKKKMTVQNSSMSLDSSGGAAGSNDKKDPKQEQQQIVTQPSNQISQSIQQLNVKLYNKLEDNFHLSNKKAMFLNIRLYYEAMGKDTFNAVPLTFHVKEGLEDPEFQRFKTYYFKEEDEVKKQKAQKAQAQQAEGSDNNAVISQSLKKNIWIVKPGENTNRGQGITVLKEFDEIKALIQESTANKKRTCIVQKYIHNPLLINKRKFDIRLYAFLSSVNGNLKGYFYQDGYLRTSCREFTLANLSNRMIHLTNDAVQKNAEDYGKYEAGNKLSYTDFQNYLDKNYGDLNICFERDLLPQMKRLVADTFRAVYGKIDPKKRINTFEIYGYDFMFDDDFKVYLIEVNTNPCLELGCPLLARLIPTMVENSLRLVVDPLFPAPENWSQKKCVVNDICPENKFELIFDDRVDGSYLTELMKEKNNIIIEIDEEELSDNEVDEKDECEMP